MYELGYKWWSRPLRLVFRLATFPFRLRIVHKRSFQGLALAEFSFRSTVENAVEGIIRTSGDKRFIFSNPAFARMLGYNSPEDLLSSIKDVSRQVYVKPEVRKDFLERLQRDGQARCEYEAWKKDGTTTWLHVSSRVVRDKKGNFLYYESIAEDVSERRNREIELAKAVEALARSNAELERFAFVVAHDLNEPLRTIRTYGGLLAKISNDSLGESAKEAIAFMTEATGRMKTLIDDILAFSQVDFRPSLPQPVDVNKVMANVLANLEVAAKEAGAEFSIGNLPAVKTHDAKMERLFQNLVSNAMKFRRAVPLHISIDAVGEGSFWKFAVRDNGIGFDPKYSEKIFEFFVQLDRRRYAGSGMGLAMCRRIVEFYGGRIWAESKPGCGTTFYFTLPKCHATNQRDWIKLTAVTEKMLANPQFHRLKAKSEERS